MVDKKKKIPLVKDLPDSKPLPPTKGDKSFKELFLSPKVGDIIDPFLIEELKKEAKSKFGKKVKKYFKGLEGKEKAKGGYVKKYAKGGGVRAARY